MRRKVIIAAAIIMYLIIGVSAANASDDWQLQQRQFEMDLQFQQQQFRQMQQEMRQQMQLMKQQFTFPNEQFRWQAPLEQQMRWQQSITPSIPIVIDSSSRISPQSSLAWRSLEAAGLTHIGDHMEQLSRSFSVMSKGLMLFQPLQLEWKWSPSQLNSIYISPNRQLEWNISSPKLGPDIVAPKPRLIETNSSAFTKGLSIGLNFGGALLKDADMMEQGRWNALSSHTLEAFGSFGVNEFIGRSTELPVNNLMKTIVGRYMCGVPDVVIGISSQIGRRSLTPNIDEITNYMDAGHTTLAGIAFGPTGATIFKAAAVAGRFITYPLFESFAMGGVRKQVLANYNILKKSWEANGLPNRSMANVYGAEYLRSIGFSSDITGLPSIRRLPSFSGLRQSSFEDVRTMPINRFLDFGTSRIEQAGVISQSRFFNPDTGVTTITRQWSVTTREITMPSNSINSSWNNPIGSPIYSFTNPMNNLTNPMNNLSNPMNNLSNPMNNLTNPMNNLTNPMNNLTNPMNNLTNPMNNLTNPMNNLTNPMNNLTNPMNNLTNPMNNLTNPMNNIKWR